MRVAILMPAYNECERLASTLLAVRDVSDALGDVTVFVVDDGSSRSVERHDLPASTATFRLVLARHHVNLGQGAALETARQLALSHGPFEAFLTMDSDGQHSPRDAHGLVAAIAEGADVAFGNRFAGGSDVPPFRRILIVAARLFERLLTGLRLADAHNGLRAFSAQGLASVSIRQNRMAHATEIKQRVAKSNALVVVEVPVTVRYTTQTRAKGQRASGAAVIVVDLLGRYLFGEGD